MDHRVGHYDDVRRRCPPSSSCQNGGASNPCTAAALEPSFDFDVSHCKLWSDAAPRQKFSRVYGLPEQELVKGKLKPGAALIHRQKNLKRQDSCCSDLQEDVNKKRKQVGGEDDNGGAVFSSKREEKQVPPAGGGDPPLLMHQSCSDAGRQSPVSWLVGWEYNPPVDGDLDLEFGAPLEEEGPFCGEPIMEIEKISPALQMAEESSRGCEELDLDRKDFFDVAMEGTDAASANNSVAHTVHENFASAELVKFQEEITVEALVVAVDFSDPPRASGMEEDIPSAASGSVSLSGASRSPPGDVVRSVLPTVEMELMTVDKETPSEVTKDANLMESPPSGIAQHQAGSLIAAEVHTFLDVGLGRNWSNGSISSTKEEPMCMTGFEAESAAKVAASPKRKDPEASAAEPREGQATKRPKPEIVDSEAASGVVSGQERLSPATSLQGRVELTGRGATMAAEAVEEDLGVGFSIECDRVSAHQGTAAAWEGDKEGGYQTMALEGNREGGSQVVGSALEGDKEGSGQGIALPDTVFQEQGDDQGIGLALEDNKEGGDQDLVVTVQGDKEGGDRDVGFLVQGSNRIGDQDMGFRVQGDKEGGDQDVGAAVEGGVDQDRGLAGGVKGDNQGMHFEVEVDKTHSDEGPGLVVTALQNGGAQGMELRGGLMGGVKKCTDLTNLLDELSGDSDCPEDFDDDDDVVEMDTSWWQKPGASSRTDDIPSASHGMDWRTADPGAESAPSTAARVSDEERNAMSMSAVQRAGSGEKRTRGPSEGAPSTSVGALGTSCSPPPHKQQQLPNVAGSFAMHTIDVPLDATRGASGRGPAPHAVNLLQRVGSSKTPEIVVLDSDSDDEDGDVVMINRHDESARFRSAVKLEHDVIRSAAMDAAAAAPAPEMDDEDNDEDDRPILSSITVSGSFHHARPQVWPPLQDASSPATRPPGPGAPSQGHHGLPFATLQGSPLPDGNSPHLGRATSGHGVSSSGQPGPSSVHYSRPLTSTRDHIHHHDPAHNGTKKLRKVQQWRKKWLQARQGQRVSAEQLKACMGTGNPLHARPPQANASPSAHINFANPRPSPSCAPHQNGQTDGSVSMIERLLQANRAQVRPAAQDAAHKERIISPLSTCSPHMGTVEHIRPLGSSPMYNRPSTLMPPLQERRQTLATNHHPWHYEGGNAGSSKGEPVSDNTKALGPQTTENNNKQLTIVKPKYDSTVSTPRVAVQRALESYNYYLQVAQLKVEEQRREMAQRATGSEPPLGAMTSARVDIHAYNDMKKENEDVNRSLVVGDVPGIEVGDTFIYRHQMAIVGLHHLPNCGIAYGYPPPENIITATAIVCMPKGGYADNVDNGDKVLYTGQGGRAERNQSAPFVEHQKLEKGNKALWSNLERKVPVRMIRAHAVVAATSNRKMLGYTYDGLYAVVDAEYNLGVGGFNVYKFRLERLSGQLPISPCIQGCTAHPWNDAQSTLAPPLPLRVVEPEDDDMDIKQILGVEDDTAAASPPDHVS